MFGRNTNNAILTAAKTIQSNEDNEVEMTMVNPASKAAEIANSKQLKNLEDKLARQEKNYIDMAESRRKANKASSSRKKKKTTRGKATKKKKNGFGQQKEEMDTKELVITVASKEDATDSTQKEKTPKERRLSSRELMRQNTGRKNTNPVWKMVADPNGKTYYHNVVDGSVSWTKPDDDNIIPNNKKEYKV